MTEDEQRSSEPSSPRRPIVDWQRTGRTRERAAMFGAFAFGLVVGALLLSGAAYARNHRD